MWILLRWIGRILSNKNMTIEEKRVWIRHMWYRYLNRNSVINWED